MAGLAAPFYNAIKGTTAGTSGTGAFTPNAASTGFRAWSNVPTGWIGMVRYEDGSAWELRYGYWNGTTITRPTNGFFDSSTGSGLTLTSAATAALVMDAGEVQPHIGGTSWRGSIANPSSTYTMLGIGHTNTGSSTSAGSFAATNYLTEQARTVHTSATTANAQSGISNSVACGIVSTSAGRGGIEYVARFGTSQQPTGPRLFAGLTSTTYLANTGEPSALTANVACFAKDSTDTNIQLLVNSNAGTGTKTDTGIPLTTNGWYEASVWMEPGSNKVYGLLIRLDTGDIWFGSTTTDVPATGALMLPMLLGGLSATTGTAFKMEVGSMFIRAGS